MFNSLNITIVGLGLIGGSYAMALKELNPKNIWAVDIDEHTLKKAEELKVINKGFTSGKMPLKDSDIVIICLYPSLTSKFIIDNMNEFKNGAIITDTAGIKEEVMNEIIVHLRDDLDFIGGHPMTGREFKGLDFATKDIFKDSNYIITPTSKNKEENIKLLEYIIKRIGCRNIVKITPKKHDEIVAFTSQLPHVVASALINSNLIDNNNKFIGGSFRDITRVAYINCELWPELLISNSENLMHQIKLFEENIERFKTAIMKKDIDLLRAILKEGSLKREDLI